VDCSLLGNPERSQLLLTSRASASDHYVFCPSLRAGSARTQASSDFGAGFKLLIAFNIYLRGFN
jgi:hypothetical protein